MKQLLPLFLISTLLVPSMAYASDKEFDPNFIISDEELQYWQSMDQSDIQRFLDGKDGYISTMRIDDTDGNRKLASEIIYDTAKKYHINPKYLIVKLQKEQSLVTENDPTQKQLDWATGYGVCDSCSMNDPRIQKFRGFGNQVDYAAGIMRWYYDNVEEQGFIKRPGTTYLISGEQVRPATLATAFLYTYTPHILGNKNFWKLWNTWFESRYPNGTLIKGETDSDVYLLQDGKKRKFGNYTALITRFDPNLIVTVPDAELADYANGAEIDLPNYAVLQRGSKYYLLDYDTLRPFASEAVVRDLGYNPAEIIEVTAADIAGYTIGSTIRTGVVNPLGELVYVPVIDKHYYVKDGVYQVILDERIIPINYAHLSPRTVDVDFFEDLTEGDPVTVKDGVIFGVEGYNKIYVMENGVKRHIANEAVFEGLGYDWNNIKWVSVYTGPTIPEGEPLTSAPNRTAPVSDAVEFDVDLLDDNATTADYVPTEEDLAKEDDPVSLMLRTPADEVTFVGPEYDTDIETYLVYDVDAEEIVAGKNIDFARSPASLQKVATAYLLADKGLSLRGITTYDPAKHNGLYHRYRVAAGEQIRNENLLDAFLVSSLNTPGRMLVDKTTGDEARFIADLNDMADTLGLHNTTFVDVTGEQTGNMTTAREYLTLFSLGLDDALISQYMGKTYYEYTAVLDKDGFPDHFDYHSNDLLRKKNLPYTILASKTGFLWESGGNLAMHVERDSDGKEFIIITMGNPNFDDRYTDPDILTRWALDQF